MLLIYLQWLIILKILILQIVSQYNNYTSGFILVSRSFASIFNVKIFNSYTQILLK